MPQEEEEDPGERSSQFFPRLRKTAGPGCGVLDLSDVVVADVTARRLAHARASALNPELQGAISRISKGASVGSDSDDSSERDDSDVEESTTAGTLTAAESEDERPAKATRATRAKDPGLAGAIRVRKAKKAAEDWRAQAKKAAEDDTVSDSDGKPKKMGTDWLKKLKGLALIFDDRIC